MKSKAYLKWLNLVALAVVVAVNALANLIPIGGNTTGQVSAAYPTLFTPAPFTFSIWGAIYILMLVFALFQMELINDRVEGAVMRSEIGAWFALSCAANVCWMLSWHFRLLGLSMVFMVCLLVCLLQIFDRASMHGASSPIGKVSIAGFQLYLGWICAAAIANLSVFLTKIQWNGFGMPDSFWTVIALIIAIALGIALSLASDAPIATLGIVWAFAGIFAKHVSSTGYAGQHQVIIAVVTAGMVLMVAAMVIFVRKVGIRSAHRPGDIG